MWYAARNSPILTGVPSTAGFGAAGAPGRQPGSTLAPFGAAVPCPTGAGSGCTAGAEEAGEGRSSRWRVASVPGAAGAQPGRTAGCDPAGSSGSASGQVLLASSATPE